MSEVIDQSADPIQIAVEELLARGTKRGYVTWEEMNEILPDNAIDPTQLEIVLMNLEDAKIDTLDEADAARYERRRKGRRQKRNARKGDGSGDSQGRGEDFGQNLDRVLSEITVEAGVKRIDENLSARSFHGSFCLSENRSKVSDTENRSSASSIRSPVSSIQCRNSNRSRASFLP